MSRLAAGPAVRRHRDTQPNTRRIPLAPASFPTVTGPQSNILVAASRPTGFTLAQSPQSALQMNRPSQECRRRRLRAVGNAQLTQNVFYMLLNRVFTDRQTKRDLLVALTLYDSVQNVQF